MNSRPSFPSRVQRLPVAVLGAGVTGLAAAWHLRQRGVPVAVFEAEDRAGGAIETIREDGWLRECGPNSIMEGSPETSALIDALGLGPRRLYAGEAGKRRYIVRNGRLVCVPTSPVEFLTTGLFSWRAKLRLASEPFRPRSPLAGVESVADFCIRRLGHEFLDYAVDPFVGGVYAGDPAKLSLRRAFPRLHALEERYGSLIRGAIRMRNGSGGPKGRILSFPDGLEELPRRLSESLGSSLHLGTRVRGAQRTEEGWLVALEQGGQTRTLPCSSIVCALPAAALGRLRIDGTARPVDLSILQDIPHPAVVSVFTGFRREDVVHPLDGFGVLVPKAEWRNILGTLFSSSLFPGRAPAGHVALTTFVGGARQPALAGMDDPSIVELVCAELADLLGIRGSPVFVRVRRHPRAIPQYTLDFDQFEATCAKAEAAAPGLYIGGNCRDGVSLTACLASGLRLASAAAGLGALTPIPS